MYFMNHIYQVEVSQYRHLELPNFKFHVILCSFTDPLGHFSSDKIDRERVNASYFLFCVTSTDIDVESKGVGRCGRCTYLKASLYYPVMELRFQVVHFKYLYNGQPSPSGRFSTYPFGAFLIWDRGRQPHSQRAIWSSGRTVGPLRYGSSKAAQFGPHPPCSSFGEIVLVLFFFMSHLNGVCFTRI